MPPLDVVSASGQRVSEMQRSPESSPPEMFRRRLAVRNAGNSCLVARQSSPCGVAVVTVTIPDARAIAGNIRYDVS